MGGVCDGEVLRRDWSWTSSSSPALWSGTMVGSDEELGAILGP